MYPCCPWVPWLRSLTLTPSSSRRNCCRTKTRRRCYSTRQIETTTSHENGIKSKLFKFEFFRCRSTYTSSRRTTTSRTPTFTSNDQKWRILSCFFLHHYLVSNSRFKPEGASTRSNPILAETVGKNISWFFIIIILQVKTVFETWQLLTFCSPFVFSFFSRQLPLPEHQRRRHLRWRDQDSAEKVSTSRFHKLDPFSSLKIIQKVTTRATCGSGPIQSLCRWRRCWLEGRRASCSCSRRSRWFEYIRNKTNVFPKTINISLQK